MAVERTLSIIKPDAVASNVIGKIYSRFETNGLRIVAAQMRHLSRAEAQLGAGDPDSPLELCRFRIGGCLIRILKGSDYSAAWRAAGTMFT